MISRSSGNNVKKLITWFICVEATFSDIEGLEIASGTSRYRKLVSNNNLVCCVGATFSDIEGLEIASGTSRYRKILLGVKYGRSYDDFTKKCHGEFFWLVCTFSLWLFCSNHFIQPFQGLKILTHLKLGLNFSHVIGHLCRMWISCRKSEVHSKAEGILQWNIYF